MRHCACTHVQRRRLMNKKKRMRRTKINKYDQKIRTNPLLAHTSLHIPFCGIFHEGNRFFILTFVDFFRTRERSGLTKHAKEEKVILGSKVLSKQNKLSINPPFDPEPYTITIHRMPRLEWSYCTGCSILKRIIWGMVACESKREQVYCDLKSFHPIFIFTQAIPRGAHAPKNW